MSIIQDTWFYETNLKKYTELQNLILSDQKTKLEVKNTILSGNTGVGKTYTAILLAKEHIIQTYAKNSYWHYSFEPYFISFAEYIRLLKNRQFGTESEKSEAWFKLRDIKDTPFLIFDDLSIDIASNHTQNEISTELLDLITHFYENKSQKTLIVTTNNSKEELENFYSKAICSRLFGLCEYKAITGKDKRINQN